ncbi:hypothetical protein Q4512_14030 [Oceanihabitans sp. 2_MG-2023]|uniref:hypothetical protein n=1 Tax=Oceanihabitans sp. 2_MG-2023 TaxID=3062661 RepID=UPI0026E1A7A3|nr:hypothetical protein [Oceanihabitans sp. 2_MG-2023]MDO6598037.1 hypothetical protein [Oceanihabitans sp. 2_MG-2023]
MKLVSTLFLVTFSFFTTIAQESELVNELKVYTITTENISIKTIDTLELSFIVDQKSIARKKSYKYIIENTLSGRKHLIFKRKRSNKLC